MPRSGASLVPRIPRRSAQTIRGTSLAARPDMARFSDDEIIGRVALHSGLGLDAAARATRGVLQRIASELDAAIRTRLIEELPLRMAAAAAERDVGVAQPIEAH